VFEFLKHITPKIKILFLSLFLILIPGTIISYLSLKSIQEKADNQRIKFHGTANLVKDKLESKLYQLETNFRNSLIDSILILENETELQNLLQLLDFEYPAFTNLLLVGSNGELIAGLLTHGQNSGSRAEPSSVDLKEIFSKAEKKEFIEKNYTGAIGLYRSAYNSALSLQDKVNIHSRIGRNYYKLGRFKTGILEYEKILAHATETTSIGNIPASIVALHQIAEGYQEIGALNDRNKILLDLYRQLLHHPWDLSGGDYLFYLNSVSHEIREMETSPLIDSTKAGVLDEMRSLEERILDQSTYIHLIESEILDKLISDLNHLTSSEIHHRSYQAGPGPAIDLGYFLLPPSMQQDQFLALAFQFDKDYLLTELFPRELADVALGKDITVGILNKTDSLVYLQIELQLSSYLVAENFTQFFIPWKVALFDSTGKTIEQLSAKERHLYLGLFIGILAVMLMGILILSRAVIHESEISRMKSEFVSNVTHELKTPLSLIRMFGETLDSGIVTEESKRREFYSIIRKESERLTHLINNVLDYSRIDSGNKEYDFDETDLVTVIRHSLEAYKFHIRDMGFEIESKIPGEPVMIPIDKDAISQAFLNLLSNAVKYSEERKHICVEIVRETNSVLISVTDKGIGIARNELKKIFDKFYRVPNNMVKKPRGSGLGLTLTRHIVEAHRGNIEVDSEPGRGSRFSIRLPLT
jgi:signal transduction histidine kinase